MLTNSMFSRNTLQPALCHLWCEICDLWRIICMFH